MKNEKCSLHKYWINRDFLILETRKLYGLLSNIRQRVVYVLKRSLDIYILFNKNRSERMWIMFKKNRSEPEDLRVMKALNYRMELPDKDKQYYLNLQKGFEGEVLFDEYLQRIEIESFILNDLLFELNHSHFQIDSLLISQDHLHLFEVKNYEGEFYFEGEKFKKINGVEVKNPMLQLDRNESLFRQLMHSFHLKIPIRAYLIFINPEFTLYQAPLDRRIILPTNLNRLIQQIDTQKSTLNNQHARLSEKLLSAHLTKSPFSKVPEYDYNELRKGVFCESCGTVMEEYQGHIFTCKKCAMNEKTDKVVLRNVQEYKLLFPHKKISTNSIFEWCGGVFPKKTIKQILKKNFEIAGYGRWSYFE